MKVVLGVFLIALFFNGCAPQKVEVPKKKVYPAWYSSPMNTNTDTMYEVGSGKTKREAINNALNEILATLSVSISSEYNSKTQVAGASYQNRSSHEIKSKIQEIKINNYEVINENDFGFEQYLVQVRIEKQKFFTGLKQELDSKLFRIQERSDKHNALEQLAVYKEDKESIKNIRNILSVMYALNSDFDDSEYIEAALEIDNRYTTLLSSISFSIDLNRDASNLKASFSKALSDENFYLRSSSDENHFVIDVVSSTSNAKAYGFNLARSAIAIKVKDYKGTVIGSNKFNLVGQSTQGYKVAKENVTIKLNKKISKDGIAKVIGLNL